MIQPKKHWNVLIFPPCWLKNPTWSDNQALYQYLMVKFLMWRMQTIMINLKLTLWPGSFFRILHITFYKLLYLSLKQNFSHHCHLLNSHASRKTSKCVFLFLSFLLVFRHDGQPSSQVKRIWLLFGFLFLQYLEEKKLRTTTKPFFICVWTKLWHFSHFVFVSGYETQCFGFVIEWVQTFDGHFSDFS